MWSQIRSSRPIGDKLARQIERDHGKPAGWLDEARESVSAAPPEQVFLDLALKAWRGTHSAGRNALRERMKRVAATGTDGLAVRLATDRPASEALHGAVREFVCLQGTAWMEAA